MSGAKRLLFGTEVNTRFASFFRVDQGEKAYEDLSRGNELLVCWGGVAQ
jgi:hypothetical protein